MRVVTHPARPPETETEDVELVSRARAGDERALAALLERYRLFARHLARPYFLTGSMDEDLVQEAMIGLYKAIRDFDVAHEAPFRAFAKLCIQRQIATAIKGANRLKHQPLNRSVSLEAPLRSQEGDAQVGDALPSSLPQPEELVISGAEVEALRELICEGLTQLEAAALRLYLDGHSYTEIAAALGNHAKAIDNSLQRIRSKVRRHLAQRSLTH
jgi:RNA polymerase sporulation-specific sigma factor